MKALAVLKGWRHNGHGFSFEAVDKISKELKDKQIMDLFMAAGMKHTNFYEGWLTEQQVLRNSERAKKFIQRIKSYINEREKSEP